jgi:hypothetical protein
VGHFIGMKKVHTGKSGYLDVFEDDGAMYLVGLCARIAWTHVGMVMNSEERLAFLTDPFVRRGAGTKNVLRFQAISESLRSRKPPTSSDRLTYAGHHPAGPTIPGLGEKCQYSCVDSVRFRQPADGPGEVPDLPGIDSHHPKPSPGQRCDRTPFGLA